MAFIGNIGSFGGYFSWLKSPMVIFFILLVIILLVIGFMYWWYMKQVGVAFAKAIVRIKDQSGNRYVDDTITEIRKKNSTFNLLRRHRHEIPPVPDEVVSQFGRKGRIVFMNRHQSTDGKFYYTYIKYYDKLVVPPNQDFQTIEFQAPINTNVMKWGMSRIQEASTKYPAWYEKHPGLVIGGIIVVGMLCFTFIVIGVNMVK